MLPELSSEELSAALDAVAGDLLVAADIDEPPIDPREVATRLGIAVAWNDFQAGRAHLASLADGGSAAQTAIIVRHDERPEREHWAIAHEIGEAAAHRVFAHLGVDPREAPLAAREEIANRLAGRLLLPTGKFRAAGMRCDWDVPKIKERFATASHELVARRMLDLEFPVLISIFDHGRLTWRKSNLPGRVPPLSRVERRCREKAHETGGHISVDDRGSRVQCWAIHEPGWKREILRTELDPEAIEEGGWG